MKSKYRILFSCAAALLAFGSVANAQVTALTFSCAIGSAPLTIGTAYNAPCTASGGVSPDAWSITAGQLPNGLNLNASTGNIGGTPTVAGTFNFTVTVTDNEAPQQTASQTYALTVSGTSPLFLSPNSLTFNSASGSVPPPQGIVISSSGGSIAYTVSVTTTSGNAVTPGSTWFTVSPGSGTTGLQPTIQVSINPTGLAALSSGVYMGNVYITTATGSQTAQIILNVSAQISAMPTSLSFAYTLGSGIPPAAQTVTVTSNPPGSFTATAATSTGGSWLSVPANTSGTTPGMFAVTANPGNLGVGTYFGQVTITPAVGNSFIVPVSLTVAAPLPPMLSVAPLTETFALTQASAPVSGQINVGNAGGGTVQFTAQSASDQGNWLTLSSNNGSATSTFTAAVGFTVNPSGLSAGIHHGTVTVQDVNSPAMFVVNVTLAVSQASQSLQLSLTGLTFNATANGPQPQSQAFGISNAGTGSINWTLQTQTDANPLTTANWLSASAPTTTSIAGQPAADAVVSVNTQGLPAGQYYGSVIVSSPGAINSAQVVTVVLNVTAQPAPAGTGVSTGTVSLTGYVGSSTPQQQVVTLFNPSISPLSYTTSTTPASGWLVVTPPGGTLLPGANPVTIQAYLGGLTPGKLTGTVTVSFGDGSMAVIQVVAVATGTGVCVSNRPDYLVPVFSQPIGNAVLQADVPATIEVEIVDDCGNPLTAQQGGSAQVTFSNGDAPLALQDAGGGVWEGTWVPVTPAAQVTLTLSAAGGPFTATTSAAVAVQAAGPNAAPQLMTVVNAAQSSKGTAQTVTPGASFTIYGNNLAGGGTPLAPSGPLLTSLNGAQVTLGGVPVPLIYASAIQINGVVPHALNPNALYPLVVQSGSTQSTPIPVMVAELQPGLFSLNNSGSGQGAILIAGTTLVAGPAGTGSRPGVRGTDYLEIYCTGLGPLLPAPGQAPPGDGAVTPLTALFHTSDTVTVTVGGVSAPVTFAGLAPGAVDALYQVDVGPIPAGATAGSAVPVVMTVTNPQDGVTAQSNTVTVALQ